MASRFKHSKTAAVRLLSIEIALKTDRVTTLALYHHHIVIVLKQEDKGGITHLDGMMEWGMFVLIHVECVCSESFCKIGVF